MKRNQRLELIREIAEVSGVAQYAFKEAIKRGDMTDEQLVKIVQQHLEAYSLLKPAVMRNRAQQRQYTRSANQRTEEVGLELQEANRRLQEFMNLENSEIMRAGRWLIDAFSKRGEERRQVLEERELVHQSDHRAAVNDMGDAIIEMQDVSARNRDEYQHLVKTLEQRIDELKVQLEGYPELEKENRKLKKENAELKQSLQVAEQRITERYGLLEWRRIERDFRRAA